MGNYVSPSHRVVSTLTVADFFKCVDDEYPFPEQPNTRWDITRPMFEVSYAQDVGLFDAEHLACCRDNCHYVDAGDSTLGNLDHIDSADDPLMKEFMKAEQAIAPVNLLEISSTLEPPSDWDRIRVPDHPPRAQTPNDGCFYPTGQLVVCSWPVHSNAGRPLPRCRCQTILYLARPFVFWCLDRRCLEFRLAEDPN